MPAIDDTYLPFAEGQLEQHFTNDAKANINYFVKSAQRYRRFLQEHPLAGVPLRQAKVPRQIEKDERFWTAASLKAVFDHREPTDRLTELLSGAFGDKPPVAGLATWRDCLDGELALYFEAQFPSPAEYTAHLRDSLEQHQMIPYILDAAKRTSQRPLEGPTHVDAVLVNTTNGFGLLIEAKVLSDISAYVSFDNYRNQLARNVDIMLEDYPQLPEVLSKRRADRSLVALLTPCTFRDRPHSRLYGWLFGEYKADPAALARDLGHRRDVDWPGVSERLGWLTFEEIEATFPGACPWLSGAV